MKYWSTPEKHVRLTSPVSGAFDRRKKKISDIKVHVIERSVEFDDEKMQQEKRLSCIALRSHSDNTPLFQQEDSNLAGK